MRGMCYVRLGLVAAGCLGFVSCLGPPLLISPETLPNAVEDHSYAESLSTSEDRSLEWDIKAGTLPPGLVLDSETGSLGGTPLAPGTYDFTVSVVRPFPRRTGSRAYVLEVLPELGVQFQPTPARVSEPYEYTPLIDGGVPPYTVSVTGLPAGLSSDPATGTISGTPLAEHADLRLELAVEDSGDPQQSDAKHATLVIHPLAIAITTTELASAPVGEAYRAELEASNGRQPFTWHIPQGSLPGGLRLDTGTGEITGTPTLLSLTQTFTISVTDSDTPVSTDSHEFKIVVPAVITSTTLPDGHAGQAYNESLGAAAGVEPYTWQITVGALPDGLALDAGTGAISGTPNPLVVNQTFTFTVQVTDGDSPPTTADQELSIQIVP